MWEAQDMIDGTREEKLRSTYYKTIQWTKISNSPDKSYIEKIYSLQRIIKEFTSVNFHVSFLLGKIKFYRRF